jgi:hypothetical protein
MIPRCVCDKSLTFNSLTEVNGETGFEPIELEGYSGMQMALKQTKALDLECMAMAQGSNLVSALGSTPQYSRQKCMP